MKKRKLTPAQLKLKAEFELMMQKHTKPLERGARAKGQAVASPRASKKGIPLLESTRVHKGQSVDTGYISTAPRKTQTYTGEAMLGVSTMHKSNSVPVFSAEAAADISKMRRG